jgi:hypothetical protein
MIDPKRVALFERHFVPEPNTGCWLWFGATSGYRGYGRFVLFRGEHSIASHRASWIIYRGQIPDGGHALHTCDTPWCVNPDHLYIGTAEQNMRDKERRGRANHATGARHFSQTKPWALARGDANGSRLYPERLARGEDNTKAKLTSEQVMDIRRRYAAGVSGPLMAREFRVRRGTILSIVRRHTWKHIP